MRIPLSIGITDNPRTWPVIQQRVKPDGIDLVPTVLHPSELFWRQLRFAEFDVSEMSISSLMMAKSKGDDRFVGIPVFTTRHVLPHHHPGAQRRQDRQAGRPQGQARRRAGVSADRGAVDARRAAARVRRDAAATWNSGWSARRRSSHGGATGFKPPPGVTVNQIPVEKSIGSMMLSGELDAVMFYLVDPQPDRPQHGRPAQPSRHQAAVPRSAGRGRALLPQDRALSDQPRHGDQARTGREASVGDHQHPQGVQAGQRDRRTRAHRARRSIISRPACCRRRAARRSQTPLITPRRQGEPQGAGDDRAIFAASRA